MSFPYRCYLAALAVTLPVLPLSPVQAQQSGGSPSIHFGVGASFLHIDDLEFAAITDFLVTEVQSHQSNHDGEMNGVKFNGGISGLMPHQRGEWLASFAAKGFYVQYEDSEQTRCVYSGTDTDCVFFPLVDPDPAGTIGLAGGADASGGFFADWLTDVERGVTHWGAAIEVNLDSKAGQAAPVSLKDAAPPLEPSPFQWRAGLALRQLDQETSLYSVDRGPTADPVTLNETLDATYYGGYFGFAAWKALTPAYRLRLSAESGLYYAKADYDATNTASASLGDDSPVAAAVSLTDSRPAFIGLLSLALERDFGATTLSLFGEAEWISYVPKVLYNDTDLNGGVPFDIVGTQNGTELGEGSALSYMIGARLSVPLR